MINWLYIICFGCGLISYKAVSTLWAKVKVGLANKMAAMVKELQPSPAPTPQPVSPIEPPVA